MNDVYHRDIVDILLEAGNDGMRVCNIARNVYNRHADLFAADLVFERIHQAVSMYLWKESLRKGSLFMRKSYGVYAIKPAIAVQMDLFIDLPQDKEDTPEPSRSNATQLEMF